MTITKHSLTNALFVLGFPCYGIGNYLIPELNFPGGILFSVLPWSLILVVFLLDVLYRGTTLPPVSRAYPLGLAYLITLVVAIYKAMSMNFPGVNLLNATALSVMYLVPLHAGLVLQHYNRANERFDIADLLLKGFSLLLLLNIGGTLVGYKNPIHTFEGRMDMPFMFGIYDGAHLVAMILLMMLFRLGADGWRPVRTVLLLAFVALNVFVMVKINSRLSTMIFFALVPLFVFRLMKVIRGIYTISLFTMPLMMNFALLIYQVLTLPVFQSILQRVDKEDVVTFNSRTYIWNAVAEWAWEDRRGMILGNGYRGHYQYGMLKHVAVMWEWDASEAYNLHMHSSFLEVLLDQGLLGLVLFYMVMWQLFKYFRRRYLERAMEAPAFAALVYMLFIWQIDIFCHGMFLGNAILFLMFSEVAYDRRYLQRKDRHLSELSLA